MATAEFPKFADILSAALSQHHLSGFEIAQLEFHWTAPAPEFTAAQPEVADWSEGVQVPSVPIQQFPTGTYQGPVSVGIQADWWGGVTKVIWGCG